VGIKNRPTDPAKAPSGSPHFEESLVLLLAALLRAALAGLLRLLTGLLAAALLLSWILLAGGLLVLLARLLIALVLLGILVWARHFKYLIDAEKREHYPVNHEELDYKLLIVPSHSPYELKNFAASFAQPLRSSWQPQELSSGKLAARNSHWTAYEKVKAWAVIVSDDFPIAIPVKG
jgi:hypothetical protein